ncbi:HNH endonuclease signature motif containing protein [Microbacterium sp. RURRCA19A]|uniref:HNH endonuclease n=1 Tax=Microbacterium sp. RURRCA19A TaxID=1907391 RepID=UPI0009571B5D|nr:HNH endonuclease signature motif containing protein [Microbacterium sp. RURRCA19A]SIR64871.1 protein of unknown function [Microbacterium sp. RURRCA19A]
MHSANPEPAPHGGHDDLSSVLSEVLAADAEVAAAEARRVRALARAGHLAFDAMAAQRTSSKMAEMALREVASEIAAAAHLSDRSVQAQIGRAVELVDDYPATLAAWEAGALSRAHVWAIVDAGHPVPVERRGEFDVLAVATAEGRSPGRLKIRLAALAERMQPTTITERHRAARTTRTVRVVPGENGMSDLIATLPTVLAVGIYDRLTQQSRSVIDARLALSPAPGAAAVEPGVQPASRPEAVDGGVPRAAGTPPVEADIRTVDQVRADLFADLLLTAAPGADPTRLDDGPGTLGAIRARVQVVVPALTMLQPGGENLDPAELVGHGPVDAETARAIAEATSVPWDRVITHPITGAVLHVDTYQRTAAIDRHLRARDRHCRWPGCTAPAVRCEVDHTHDAARGGSTEVSNLSHLCQRHHTQKQFTRWQVRQLAGGVLEWTSPTGRAYVDEPPPYSPAVRFVPDPPPTAPPVSDPAPF